MWVVICNVCFLLINKSGWGFIFKWGGGLMLSEIKINYGLNFFKSIVKWDGS